jgi:5-methylcytosine-specific restriction protein A
VRIMPSKSKKPCSKMGCPNLTTERYCDGCKQPEQRKYEQLRGTSAERGYDSKWRKARLGFLAKHPLCVHCTRDGGIGAATVVDHIKPHKGDKVLFWERDNWQPLCKRHHDIKTVKEDGGFGNG